MINLSIAIDTKMPISAGNRNKKSGERQAIRTFFDKRPSRGQRFSEEFLPTRLLGRRGQVHSPHPSTFLIIDQRGLRTLDSLPRIQWLNSNSLRPSFSDNSSQVLM